MRRIFSGAVIGLLAVGLAGFAGCSSESEKAQTTTETVAETAPAETAIPEPVTLRDTIEYNLNLAIQRLSLGDKSGLYENEFEYLKKKHNFDDYLRLAMIQNAKADSVKYLKVVDVQTYGHDSADVRLVVRFEGPSGIPTDFDDRLTVYFHNGRWIKPTASNIAEQVKFEQGGGK